MNNKPHTTSHPFHSAKEEHLATTASTSAEYKLAVTDLDFLMRDELRPVRLQLELLRPELVLKDHSINQTAVFFGSARTVSPEIVEEKIKKIQAALSKELDNLTLKKLLRRAQTTQEVSQYLAEATKLAYKIATESSLTVVTGGGPGFMSAANRGAYEADKPSVSLGIVLPHEQKPNPYVTPELTFQFHYFAVRKMHFLMRAKVLIAFPGGFGTLDEIFETLMLLQTQKIERLPFLLFGKKFWQDTINFEKLVDTEVISEQDLELFRYVETADEAWEFIKSCYLTHPYFERDNRT